MIYKQRPEATACTEYDLWNERMNRYVKRGSKGIALLDMRGEQPIIQALDAAFDVPAGAGSLENHIMEAAERLVRDLPNFIATRDEICQGHFLLQSS